jgi:hypothetical protein
MPVIATLPCDGFSTSDLATLARVQAERVRNRIWGRVQLVQDGPADFLAVWDPLADDGDAPMLAIARFKRTGTYAVSRGDYLVTTGRTLEEVINTLASKQDPAVFRGAEHE